MISKIVGSVTIGGDLSDHRPLEVLYDGNERVPIDGVMDTIPKWIFEHPLYSQMLWHILGEVTFEGTPHEHVLQVKEAIHLVAVRLKRYSIDKGATTSKEKKIWSVKALRKCKEAIRRSISGKQRKLATRAVCDAAKAYPFLAQFVEDGTLFDESGLLGHIRDLSVKDIDDMLEEDSRCSNGPSQVSNKLILWRSAWSPKDRKLCNLSVINLEGQTCSSAQQTGDSLKEYWEPRFKPKTINKRLANILLEYAVPLSIVFPIV